MIVSNGNDVVMVDDSLPELLLAGECFRRAGVANQWRTFSGGAEFLAYMSDVRDGVEEMPAVVLMDINMPRKNGLEVVAATKAIADFTDRPPFMMFTNSLNPADRERAHALGTEGLKVKPDNVADYVAFFASLAGSIS